MVILTDDDLAELPSTSSREIAVEKFVPSDQIDPMLFEKSYYLEPESVGAKPYALLRQALLDADRMAVVTVALRQRTTTAVLRVRDDVIVMQTMMWPDEIRQPDFTIETGEIKDAEVKMAHMLVETLAGDFEPEEFEDDYAGAVQAVVKAKIEGGEVQAHPHLDQVRRRGRRPAGRPAALGRRGEDRAGRGVRRGAEGCQSAQPPRRHPPRRPRRRRLRPRRPPRRRPRRRRPPPRRRPADASRSSSRSERSQRRIETRGPRSVRAPAGRWRTCAPRSGRRRAGTPGCRGRSSRPASRR